MRFVVERLFFFLIVEPALRLMTDVENANGIVFAVLVGTSRVKRIR